MNYPRKKRVYDFLMVIGLFLVVSIFLTYNILQLPSLVLGDNVYWTRQNIVDILGPKTIRESFLGDIALTSTFKSGFLFPLAYALNALGVPLALIYPFLFYFLSMLSFYTLSAEFLTKKPLRFVVSAIYVVNPITPYYFASMLSAFVITFLPLVLKFFIRTLRETSEKHLNPNPILRNFLICAAFLAISVSAHEQFFFSALFMAVFLLPTFLIVCRRVYGLNRRFLKTSIVNISLFASVFFVINMPLVLSLSNISNAPLSTYFRGSFSDFLANVRYSYASANPQTLLRLGGDSGVGLEQSAWYDSSSYTNLFGYVLFCAFLVSVILLVMKKQETRMDRAFFAMNIAMFVGSISLIELIRYLPENSALSAGIFSIVLQTWESPTKLRVILLLSLLTTTLIFFRRLETHGTSMEKRVAKSAAVTFLIFSVVLYNSPWLISYAGYTPMAQVSDNLKWGSLFEQGYSDLADHLNVKYHDSRGVLVPYTHKAELYLPPNFRLFQLVSDVKEQTVEFTQGTSVAWSKLLGLLSARYVVLGDIFQPGETLMFPQPFDSNITRVLGDIRSDSDLTFQERVGNYTIYENENCLPISYATKNFVFYDDVSTLKYAVQLMNFKDLPVFLDSGGEVNQVKIPDFTGGDTYCLNALKLADNSSASGVSLTVTHVNGNNETLTLNKTTTFGNLEVFSTYSRLDPGDILSVPGSETLTNTTRLDDLILNSTSFQLGEYGSFSLNFTVSLLEKGLSSSLGPRVQIETGNSTKYLIIFHDNGVLELSVLQNNTFTSGAKTRYVGFALNGENDFVNVTVSRVFDEVRVYVNNNPEISFPTDASASKVSLYSEESVSRFSRISVETANLYPLFVARQFKENPTSYVKQSDSEDTVLVVSNNESDFAVVSQYLYTNLRVIESPFTSHEMLANAFFNGWIVNGSASDSSEISIRIGLQPGRQQMMIGITIVSVASSVLILIVTVDSLQKRILSFVSKKLSKIKRSVSTEGA